MVPPEDAGSLAAAILQLADDPAQRDRLSKAGRALVEREYSWDAVVQPFLEAIAR